MTREKYEASQNAMSFYQRQFSIKGTVCDRVAAFKLGLSGQGLQQERRHTQQNSQSQTGGIRVNKLESKDKREKAPEQHKPKLVSRKPSTIKSYRGIMIKEDEEVAD